MRVRVIDPAISAGNTLLLLVVNAGLLAAAVAAVSGSLARRPSAAPIAPARSWIIGALLLALLGLVLIGPIRAAVRVGDLRAALPLVSTGLIALAWIRVGAALRVGGSRRRGAALAAALYLIVGLGWVTDYNAALGLPLTKVIADPSFIFAALVWPLQVAQLLGLFGLTIG